MPKLALRQRSEVPVEYTWNAPSVFPTTADWQKEADDLRDEIPQIKRLEGSLAGGPEKLLAAYQAMEKLSKRAFRVLVYAALTQAVNTADPQGAEMVGKAQSLLGQLQAAASFIEPETLAIGPATLDQWMATDQSLKVYAHYFEDLFRKAAHVRSKEVEELLGMVSTPFSGTQTTAEMLVDADFRFPPARNSQGETLEVSQGTIHGILSGSDREARKTAWEGFMDTHLAYRNTLASNLSTAIQQDVFKARVQRYDTSLEASLSESNIPVEVFHNLIETFQRNLPTWHRYWAVRRKMLGVDSLAPYDIWAPLTRQELSAPYLDAVEWVSAALAPLGEDYVQVLRKGVLQKRWIDVYPSQNKASAQFSAGGPGTHPFIFLNYDDTIFSASTLAHELGHSMHSCLTWNTQPFIYSDYSLFVAEVASNFHQAMLRAYLLARNPDPAFQVGVIEEAMSNFHRYFFVMPTLARFELEMHQRAERGEGLNAEIMIERMADLFAEGYGDEMQFDRERTGITWATFGHLYANFYVYQYATGISAANALSKRVLSGEPEAAERYRQFLKSGSSLYPLDVLKQAGVDLTTPEPVEEAFQVLAGLVDRLEKLAG